MLKEIGDVMTRNANTHDLTNTLARGLGWFSVGLGLAELLAPRLLTRALGMQGRETLIRSYGVREISNGMAIVASKDRAPWVWARVGGDVLDLLTLAAHLHPFNRKRKNIVVAIAAVKAILALDLFCARALSAKRAAVNATRSGLSIGANQMRGAANEIQLPLESREQPPAAPAH
jgi:hypothetical protein